MSSFSGLRVT